MAVVDRNLEAARERVAAIRSAGGTAEAFQADVSVAAEVEAAVRAAEAAHGACDVLFNHAGTIVIRPFLETTEEELMHTVFPHPTVSEAMHEAVLDAYGRVIHI